MTGSFIDVLPPEAQHVVGGAAVLVIAAGIVVWAAGVKIARFSVAILLGLGMSALGAWLLPLVIGVEAATGGIVGFVVGALAGALGFRLLQGLILATCLGVAVAGVYYRWHVGPISGAPVAATQADVQELLIPTDRLAAGASGAATKPAKRDTAVMSAAVFAQSVVDHWKAIPQVHRTRLLTLSVGSAAVALLIAFGFARQTTWVISAMLGSLMILSGVRAIVHVYSPQYETYFPATAKTQYATLAVMTLVGMLVQHRLFPRKRAVKKAPPPGDSPAAAQVQPAA